MSKPQRYYSGGQQQYSLVGNSAAFHTNNELDQYGGYDDHARTAYGVRPGPTVNDDHPLNSYDSQSRPLTYDNLNSLKGPKPIKPRKAGWSRRRKFIVFGGIALLLIIVIAVVVGVVVALTHKSKPFDPNFTLSNAQVTNDTAFADGGATKSSPSNTNDGIGAGTDEYTYYSGTWDTFPKPSAWISFEDMWNGNLYTLQHACSTLKEGKDNSDTVNQEIYEAIQNRSEASLVDHRYIFAVILQETHGCARAGSTTSQSGVKNPGLMQSHDGHSYSAQHSNISVLAMVQDGTQGTDAGDGLVQNLNMYGNAYSAARGYNSGYIPKSGNLSEAAGATACYVSDIANRLTGWVNATSKCSDSGS